MPSIPRWRTLASSRAQAKFPRLQTCSRSWSRLNSSLSSSTRFFASCCFCTPNNSAHQRRPTCNISTVEASMTAKKYHRFSNRMLQYCRRWSDKSLIVCPIGTIYFLRLVAAWVIAKSHSAMCVPAQCKSSHAFAWKWAKTSSQCRADNAPHRMES